MTFKNLPVFVLCAAVGLASASPALIHADGPAAAGQADAKDKSSQNTQSQRPGRWWDDDKTRKELGITSVQTKQIDDVYNSAKDELAADWDVYQRERRELDRLILESKVERWVVARQIDKTETLRSNYNKLWLMTLYRMHQALTPEQRVKLQQINERNRSGRGRDGRGAVPSDLRPGR